MQEQESVMVFKQGVRAFMSRLRLTLLERLPVRLSTLTTPQNWVSLYCDNHTSKMQLRFVVLVIARDRLLGRLSWLDKEGRDHVCCYVNERFQCVSRKANGHWREQGETPAQLCAKCWVGLAQA